MNGIGSWDDAAVTDGSLRASVVSALKGLLSRLGTQLPAALGQTTKAGSLPVTVASDQGSLGTVDSADIPTAPNEYNVALANANTEYSQALPATCRAVAFRCRNGAADVRYAWATGKVAGPTAPYQQLAANAEYFKDTIEAASKTLYFASGTAGVVVEMEAWS